MQIEVRILRQDHQTTKPYWQSFPYEGEGQITVADFLRDLNAQPERRDADNRPARPITWECSCMEQKCGACAMLINGTPKLACAAFLKDVAKRGKITLAPLSKFPVVQDLQVDRTSMFEMLKEMRLWVTEEEWYDCDWDRNLQFSAGQCLLCGCCLEACANYLPGGLFGGAAALANANKAREFNIPDEHGDAMKTAYEEHFFHGCGQSLSCQKVCPAELPLDMIQARMNKR